MNMPTMSALATRASSAARAVAPSSFVASPASSARASSSAPCGARFRAARPRRRPRRACRPRRTGRARRAAGARAGALGVIEERGVEDEGVEVRAEGVARASRPCRRAARGARRRRAHARRAGRARPERLGAPPSAAASSYVPVFSRSWKASMSAPARASPPGYSHVRKSAQGAVARGGRRVGDRGARAATLLARAARARRELLRAGLEDDGVVTLRSGSQRVEHAVLDVPANGRAAAHVPVPIEAVASRGRGAATARAQPLSVLGLAVPVRERVADKEHAPIEAFSRGREERERASDGARIIARARQARRGHAGGFAPVTSLERPVPVICRRLMAAQARACWRAAPVFARSPRSPPQDPETLPSAPSNNAAAACVGQDEEDAWMARCASTPCSRRSCRDRARRDFALDKTGLPPLEKLDVDYIAPALDRADCDYLDPAIAGLFGPREDDRERGEIHTGATTVGGLRACRRARSTSRTRSRRRSRRSTSVKEKGRLTKAFRRRRPRSRPRWRPPSRAGASRARPRGARRRA